MCGEKLDDASLGWNDGHGCVICDYCYDDELTDNEREEYYQ